jgi:small subunit ribosomal protein S21
VAYDKAVKLLKKIMSKEGILQEIKERRYYEKPSDKKRRERNFKKGRK